MRSMYRFSIIALAVASLALVAAGAAFGAAHEGKGVKVGGSFTTDVENFTDQSNAGNDSKSEIRLQTEAILDFSANAGPLAMKIRLEINDTNNGFNNTRHTLTWNINDQMSLAMAGASHGFKAGIAPYGASSVGHLSPMGGNVGDWGGNTQLVFAINQQTIDFTFKLGGGADAGLMYSPNDILAGVGTVEDLSGGTLTVAADKDAASTIVPYYNGVFGGVNLHVYYAMSSTAGNIDLGAGAIDTTIKSTELSIGAVYKADGIVAVLQAAPGSIKVEDAEVKTMTINVGGTFNGIGAHYITKKWDADGTDVTDQTDIALTYTASLGDGADWSAGYGSHADKLAEETDSRIYFGMRAKY